MRIAKAVAQTVAATGTPLVDPDDPEGYAASSHFEALGPGVFWLNASVRGEGLNLADFGAAQYGPAFTVETGLIGDFAARVAMQKLTVQTAVKVFEERYA